MFAALVLALAQSIEWTRVDIDAKFRSEDVAVADFNHDGVLDIANGEAWYEAPTWKAHAIRSDGMQEFNAATQYSRCFALWAFDVSRDGWPDLISVGFPGTPCHWFENPAGKEEPWKQFEIWGDACNESPLFVDIDGDPWPELVLGSERAGTLGWLAIPPASAAHSAWRFNSFNEKTHGAGFERFAHGLGAGELFGRVRNYRDVVTPRGAWTFVRHTDAPSTWAWNPFTLGANTESPDDGAQIFVDDFDGDFDADIAMSSAHGIGVWWYEQVGGTEPEFIRHTIDESFSQSHALRYADIDGDGERDLITGKRWYAHGPDGDVDAKVEPVVVWYQVKKGSKSAPKFTRHEIEVARGTGVGTQFQVIDVDGDKRADIVLSNKRGTHLLLQRAPEASPDKK